MSRASEVIRVESGSFTPSFITAGILLVVGVVLTYFLHSHPRKLKRREIRKADKQPQQTVNA